jgi:endogenous inhibitor of DNA gyrase (YacG/DUF329 family)
MVKKYSCPQCGESVQAASKEFPFCSKRCKLIDLGAWASEKFVVKGSADEDLASTSDIPTESKQD